MGPTKGGATVELKLSSEEADLLPALQQEDRVVVALDHDPALVAGVRPREREGAGAVKRPPHDVLLVLAAVVGDRNREHITLLASCVFAQVRDLDREDQHSLLSGPVTIITGTPDTRVPVTFHMPSMRRNCGESEAHATRVCTLAA